MFRLSLRSIVAAGIGIFAAGSVLFAQETYDYSHRISEGSYTKDDVGAKANASIKATLIRNHFGFGGQINAWSFDTIIKGEGGVTQNYFDAFRQYFDYATPENEMKWTTNMWGEEKPEEAWFGSADRIYDSCSKYGIKVRGHNLFWNEKKDWIPEWSRELGTTDFYNAMRYRVSSAMSHWKGKLAQWDIINEIIHGENGSKPADGQGLLEKMSGNANIFSWILDTARAIDPETPFVINDYNLSTSNDVDSYIAKCKPLKDKFQIIGDEGHWGGTMPNKTDIDTKINKMCEALNMHAWYTEIDWSFDVAQSPAKMELLMRASFANKNIDGMVLWVWCKRKMWRELNSYLVDSLFVETETGKTWKKVRAEFKTDTTVTADADGNFKIKGYQGTYQLVSDGDTAVVNLLPGNKVEVVSKFKGGTPVKPSVQSKTPAASIMLNGKPIELKCVLPESKQMYISAYTISGKLISKTPLTFNNGTAYVSNLPKGCNTYRIGTVDKTYYTGVGVQVR